jgi:membrane protein YqaA with SNARE-associated domain
MFHWLSFFFHLGALGLLLMGILDSSFLFIPVGNDLLLIVLTVRHPENLAAYVVAASIGSGLGVMLVDLVSRKGGEKGLTKIMSPRHLGYLREKIKSNAAVVLAIAALAPPPFPFTAVVAAASALDYPRPSLLGVIVAGRLVRFTLVGLAAVRFGRPIIAVMRSSEFFWCVVVFATICIAGSAMSVAKWSQGRQS